MIVDEFSQLYFLFNPTQFPIKILDDAPDVLNMSPALKALGSKKVDESQMCSSVPRVIQV